MTLKHSSVSLTSDARLQRYVRNVPAVAWDLLDVAVKPTTIILDGAVNLAPNLIAEDGSIALRITKEPFSHELCYRFQKALVSTSANISGQPSLLRTIPTSAKDSSAVSTMYASPVVRSISRILQVLSSSLSRTVK